MMNWMLSRITVLAAFAMLGVCVAADSETAPKAIYQVVRHNLPKELSPGQRLVAKMDVKLVKPGDPMFQRLGATLIGGADRKHSLRLQPSAFTPWRWPAEQKVGDVLPICFTLDLPGDFPPGEAALTVEVFRKQPDGPWESATIWDEDGKTLGLRFPWNITVKGSEEPLPEARPAPLVITKIDPPAIDGVVGADEWSGAATVDALVDTVTGKPPKAATRCRVGYDDTHLYVAFVCEEPQADKLVIRDFEGQRDPPVWSNDCVEVFISAAEDPADYVHFMVDAAGQYHDALGGDSYGYNPQWERAAGVRGNGYVVEMAVPLASISQHPPKPGELWRANLCRERKPVVENTAQQPTFGAFATPNRFGAWVFESLQAHLERKVAALTLDATGWDAELDGPASEWRKDRDALVASVAAMDEPAANARYAQVMETLETLSRQASALRMTAMRLAGKGFVVTGSRPYQPFAGGGGLPLEKIEAELLGGEYLDLCFTLENPIDRPITIRCTTRSSADDKDWGYIALGLPGVSTLWRQAMPVATTDGAVVHDALATIPAGIVRLAPGEAAQVWLTLHAEPDAPRRSASGRVVFEPLDGTGAEVVEIPLSMASGGANLLSARTLSMFMWDLVPEAVMDNEPWARAHFQDLADHGVNVAMIHGLRHLPRPKADKDGNLTEAMDFTKLDRLLAITNDYFDQYYVALAVWEKQTIRRDLFGIPFESPGYEKAFKTRIRAIIDRLLANGLTYDQFMINPYDESVNEACRTMARWIKEADPKARIVIDCSTPDLEIARDMDALTDVWIPHHKTLFPDAMQPFHRFLEQNNKPRWFYYYSQGSNEKAQHPTLHYLSRFWLAKQRGFGGVCWWAQQYYGDPWYRARYKGAYDVSMRYPTEGGVAASRRWEAWRRGFQDHCLMELAEKTLRDAGDADGLTRLKALLEKVVTTPGDPVLADEARQWMRKAATDRR